jgi:HrpA-like RNA helicase
MLMSRACRVIRKRPDLRIVISSATVDAEAFKVRVVSGQQR